MEYTLDQITVEGSPRQLGQSHGRQLRERIQQFVPHRLAATRDYLKQRGFDGEAQLRNAGQACLDVLADWHADGYEEHLGVAEAAEVDAAELYAAANYSDIRDLVLLNDSRFSGAGDEGCTAVAIPPQQSIDQTIITGQTWDLHPRDIEFVVAIHRLPDNGPETWSLTCAGCPTLIGMNEHGLYVGTTNIKVRGVDVGIPYLGLLHKAITCSNREEAAATIKDAPRLGAHTYWLVDAKGAIELECSHQKCIERQLDHSPLARTNHCLYPEHESLQAEQPTDSSRHRYERVQELLADRGPFDVQRLRAMFADRSEGVLSINRYEEDKQYAATNACVIGVPAQRRLFACRGPADRGKWVELGFSRVGAGAVKG